MRLANRVRVSDRVHDELCVRVLVTDGGRGDGVTGAALGEVAVEYSGVAAAGEPVGPCDGTVLGAADDVADGAGVLDPDDGADTDAVGVCVVTSVTLASNTMCVYVVDAVCTSTARMLEAETPAVPASVDVGTCTTYRWGVVNTLFASVVDVSVPVGRFHRATSAPLRYTTAPLSKRTSTRRMPCVAADFVNAKECR